MSKFYWADGLGKCRASTTHVVRGRWFTVFACLWIMAGTSATYLFDMYTRELKVSLKVDQSVIDVLKTYKRLGANLGVFAGLIAEVTPSWFLLMVGAVMNFSSYYLLHEVTRRSIRLQLWQICACVFVGNNAQNFTHTAALVTCVKNFPEKRGMVIGLLKGLIGLSGAIITQLALAFYGDQSVRHILLLIAWFPAAIALAFSFTIRPMEFQRQPNELRVFLHIFYASLSLAVFLMIVTLCERFFTFPRIGYVGSGVVILFLLALPLLIAIREKRFILSLKQQPDNHPVAINTGSTTEGAVVLPDADQSQQDILMQKIGLAKGASCLSTSSIVNKPRRGEDHTILQAIFSVDMLLIFIISLTGFGSSTTAIGNLSEIAVSNDLPFNTMGNIKLLINIWNYFGRVYAGFVSELLLKQKGTPRPLMNVFALLLSCLGVLLIAFPSENGIYMATVIIGFSYGAQVTLLCTITSEIFGLKYYATLVNCTQFATPLGWFLLDNKLTQPMYHLEAKRLNMVVDGNLVCKGTTCFRGSFMIVAAVLVLGALASYVLTRRTAKFYKGDVYKKFKDGKYKSFKVQAKATETERASSSDQ